MTPLWATPSPFDSPGNFIDKAVGWLHGESVMNQLTASAMVRVTGGLNAQKSGLARLGVQIALLYFPGANRILSAECTQSVGDNENSGRWVEIRMLFLPNWNQAFGSTINITNFDGQMNLSNNIGPLNLGAGGVATLPGGTATADPSYQSFNLQNSKNGSGVNTGSRGNWLGALLVQSLQTIGEPPDKPPANSTTFEGKLVQGCAALDDRARCRQRLWHLREAKGPE